MYNQTRIGPFLFGERVDDPIKKAENLLKLTTWNETVIKNMRFTESQTKRFVRFMTWLTGHVSSQDITIDQNVLLKSYQNEDSIMNLVAACEKYYVKLKANESGSLGFTPNLEASNRFNVLNKTKGL